MRYFLSNYELRIKKCGKKIRTWYIVLRPSILSIDYNRGALGAGTAYALLLMLILGAGGVMMIGNIVPIVDPHLIAGDKILISPPIANPSGKQNALQLQTFKGVTVTPPPIPTLAPIPDFEVTKASDSAKKTERQPITAK